MLANKVLRSCASLANRRFINVSAKRFESKVSDSASKTSSSASASTSSAASNPNIKIKREIIPSAFDKFILVWMKKYPKGQVPNRIREEEIYQTKSRARVKAANYMIAITIVCCIATAWSGKQAAKSGDSVEKRNLDWHKAVNEEHKAKLKAESSQ